ncbi:MAG: hypothetical protein ABIR84_04760 [Candidatus Nitrotoga sp.]
MKPLSVILMGILILIQKSPAAMSQDSFNLKNMNCYITSGESSVCTGIPTLQSGVLAISKEGTFKVKARYEGCFMIENLTKSGKYEASLFEETMSLELLTIKTNGMKSTISDFPRTLGFANLNYDKLDGYLVDLSAVIQGRGRDTENIITLKLQCVVNK